MWLYKLLNRGVHLFFHTLLQLKKINKYRLLTLLCPDTKTLELTEVVLSFSDCSDVIAVNRTKN